MEVDMSAKDYSKIIDKQNESDPNAIYADQMREEKVANVIAQLDPANLLDEIEHRLRGEKFNSNTGEWQRISRTDEGERISELLIERFMSFLGSVLTQNTTLSNYTINEVNNRMEMVIDWIRDDLTDNDKQYCLEGNFTEMTRIGMIMCETVSSVFRRALNGMESRRVFNALKVTESLTQAPQKGTLREAMKFW